MFIEPTHLAAAPASVEYLTAVRTKCPSLRLWTDDTLLRLGSALAQLAYATTDAATVWEVAHDLGISDHEFRNVLRETLVTLYPVAAVRAAPGTLENGSNVVSDA